MLEDMLKILDLEKMRLEQEIKCGFGPSSGKQSALENYAQLRLVKQLEQKVQAKVTA